MSHVMKEMLDRARGEIIMDKYKLITELGLKTFQATYKHSEYNRGYQGHYTGEVVDADDLLKVLEKGVRLISFVGDMPGHGAQGYWAEPERHRCVNQTGKQARLINIQPIVREDAVTELVAKMKKQMDESYDELIRNLNPWSNK